LFGGIGAALWRKNGKMKKACTAQTEGAVCDVEQEIDYSTDDDGHTRATKMYYPVFTYLANGGTYVNRSATGRSSTKLQVGMNVTVFYNPDNPDQYYVAEDKASASAGAVFCIFGAAAVIIGIVIPFFM